VPARFLPISAISAVKRQTQARVLDGTAIGDFRSVDTDSPTRAPHDFTQDLLSTSARDTTLLE
jgi:hypothetical protein